MDQLPIIIFLFDWKILSDLRCTELKKTTYDDVKLFLCRYYMKARDVLNKYKHMPSFQGIHSDCEAIVLELMQCLRDQLRNPEVGRVVDLINNL